MTLHIEISVEDGNEAASILAKLACEIEKQEIAFQDAIERKTLAGGAYQSVIPELLEIDIY